MRGRSQSRMVVWNIRCRPDKPLGRHFQQISSCIYPASSELLQQVYLSTSQRNSSYSHCAYLHTQNFMDTQRQEVF